MALHAVRSAGEQGRADGLTTAPAWPGEPVRATDRLEEPPWRRFAALLALVALSGLGIGIAAGLAVRLRQGPDEPTTTVATTSPGAAVAPAALTPPADRPVAPAASASSLRAALVEIRKRIDAAQAGMPTSLGSAPALEVGRVAARDEPDAAAVPEPVSEAMPPRLHATREVVHLRAAPDDRGKVLAELEPHVIVEEIGRRLGWVQVRYIDRSRQAHAGWTRDASLRPVAGSSSPAAGARR
jgi:hypothetical protein